ncbi:DsrE family protein [Ramlibacter sp. PS4R-6]|uniref:DsrE family protein n=1 Tax=Ramlibacter sp. PS4R-6 TaxID=3133438 RepID=UPI0030A412A6
MTVTSRRSVLRTAALLPLALAVPAFAQAQAKKHRLLIAVSDNDPGKWNMVMNNVKNAQEDVGGVDKIDIEVVAYGPGINMLRSETPVAGHINDLLKTGVKVVGCENTMKNLKLEKSQMMSTIGYVPAAVTEIMRKQEEGWAYVRP